MALKPRAKRKVKSEDTEALPKVRRAPPKSKNGPDEITWERQTGTTLTTNNSAETIAYCESLGWKRV